jgi:adenosylcobyric acid synthase
MTAKAIMIQGTGSDVGKSVIVAGLCRIAKRRNFKVAPFKPQNMSNNAAACENGGEIGRAQALQALAAGVKPHIDHNPVLLKPETDRVAQVIVHGRAYSTMEASQFIDSRDTLMSPVLESFDRLAADNDLVLIEGAGSPAEINLRQRDIANMGFARRAGVPVCLLGDIERGGVIASLVGTHAVLGAEDAAMITGFVINKFRGDQTLFDDGVSAIEARTGWPCYGVIPWLPATARLPAEDAVSIIREQGIGNRSIRIVAPMLSRMANFDDADPLRLEPSVDFQFVPPGKALPRDADLVVLFGTKSTIGDLQFLREQGWDHDIIAHARSGGRVLGICGGYQMLGKRITDAKGIDGTAGDVLGLGLLDVETCMTGDKTVRPIEGQCARSGTNVCGYEIHVGESSGPDCARPMLHIDGAKEGARSPDGLVEGTYVHGLLTDDDYRSRFLAEVGQVSCALNYSDAVEDALDELAEGLESAIDIDQLFASARSPGWAPESGSPRTGGD